MYDIFPKSLKEFIEDSSIRLPRFQRKASWDYKKRFELALSIFKNYPLGASILSKEIDVNNNLTEWLLDGRQRRDTLRMMYWNPNELYSWAKKYLPIKKGMSVDDIKRVFDEKVSDFIEEVDKNTHSQIEEENGYVDNDSSDVNDEENEEMTENVSSNSETEINLTDQQELDTLLSLINIASLYKKNDQYSGLTFSFDFSDFLTGKAFVSNFYSNEDKNHVDCVKLRRFIQDYIASNNKYNQLDEFMKYLDNRFDWKSDSAKQKLENKLKSEWDVRQLKIIECFKKIDVIFLNRKIAIIETHSITATDSQKIFNLINTGGTKLTASEILSAKPRWNIGIVAPSQKIQKAITKLYEKLDHGDEAYSKFVKWDIPASSTYYFDDTDTDSGFSLFFRMNDEDVANRITNGFKIISGLLTKGVKKEEINTLYSVIDWDNYEEKLSEIKEFFETFKNDKRLKVIQSWGKSLSDVLSDGPTMNMMFILYRNWIKLGKPTGFSTEAIKIYTKNIFIALDRCFYEYLSNQWKGSSDSTIARNIESYEKGLETDENGLLKPITDSSWNSLLESLFNDNTLNGKLVAKGVLAPLVYYYNCLKGIKGEGFDNPGEIDHIMPQSLWKSSTLKDKDAIQNNVFNLALLPKNVNASKKDQTLASMNDLIADKIAEYEEINKNDFTKYSNVANYNDLKVYRENLYKNAMKIRKTILEDA